MTIAAARQRELSHITFGLDHDARHHGDRFPRIVTAGGFRREHDRIASVENCIGHVAGLRPCRARVFNHRLQHLRRSNHRLAPHTCTANYMLLNDRNFFRRHFHAEIAARHHHAVSSFQNFFEMVDGLRLFQLGN